MENEGLIEIFQAGLIYKHIENSMSQILLAQDENKIWGLPKAIQYKFETIEETIKKACGITFKLEGLIYTHQDIYPLFRTHQVTFYHNGLYLSGRARAEKSFISARFLKIGEIMELVTDSKISQPSLKVLEKAFGFNSQNVKIA